MDEDKSVECHPGYKKTQVDDDERPRTAERGHLIGDALPDSRLGFHLDVDISGSTL